MKNITILECRILRGAEASKGASKGRARVEQGSSKGRARGEQGAASHYFEIMRIGNWLVENFKTARRGVESARVESYTARG